jgi:hypothetical protein
MDIPDSIKPKPANTLELAKREYHAATIAMGELDAKVIDAAATLEELKTAYGEAVIRVNDARDARDALIDARTPPAPKEPATASVVATQGALVSASTLPLNGADDQGVRPGDMTA